MLLTFIGNPFRGLDMPILVDPFSSPLYFEPKRKKTKGLAEKSEESEKTSLKICFFGKKYISLQVK